LRLSKGHVSTDVGSGWLEGVGGMTRLNMLP
jgi:hypothetical protein